MIAWILVHAISTALIRSDACRLSTSPAKQKIAWEHSPTRIKKRESTRLNRGVASPINYPYFSSISSTCVRHASRAGHTRPATWPQRHVVTARWTRAPRGPARHVSPAWARSPRHQSGPVDKNTPLFRDFNKEIHLKIQLKIK